MTKFEFEESLSEIKMLYNYNDKEEMNFLRKQEMYLRQLYKSCKEEI